MEALVQISFYKISKSSSNPKKILDETGTASHASMGEIVPQTFYRRNKLKSIGRDGSPGQSANLRAAGGTRACRRQSEDTGNMINGRAFFIKSELTGSMKSDAFEYEIAVTSVRNRRFMLVH